MQRSRFFNSHNASPPKNRLSDTWKEFDGQITVAAQDVAGTENHGTKKNTGRYWCGKFRKYFTTQMRIPMEYAKIPVLSWIYVVYRWSPFAKTFPVYYCPENLASRKIQHGTCPPQASTGSQRVTENTLFDRGC